MLNKKRGFTFAELMISLVVIAIITVILYPTLTDMAPNNNKYLFKSAYRTLETVTSDIINTITLENMPSSQTGLCKVFCERLNVLSIKNGANPGTCNACTNFTTSNGMRWAFKIDDVAYVLVDVNHENNSDTNGDFTPIKNNADQNVFQLNPWTNDDSGTGVFYTNDDTTNDTFLFSIDADGKITPHGTVAQHHMQSGS